MKIKKHLGNQKGKPHTMTLGRDCLRVFGRKFDSPSKGRVQFLLLRPGVGVEPITNYFVR